MSARYFVDTDGYDLHLWRQEGGNEPTIVSDPVDAWHKGQEHALEALARIRAVRDHAVGRRSGTYSGVSDYILVEEIDEALRGTTRAES